MAFTKKPSAKNLQQKRGDNLGAFLKACRIGYSHGMDGQPWPDDFDRWYEYGRYMAAELKSTPGLNPPRRIFIDKHVTKEWKWLYRNVPAFHQLIEQGFRRQSFGD